MLTAPFEENHQVICHFFHQVNLAKLNMNSNCKPVVQHHTLGHAHMRPYQEASKQIYSNISEHVSCNTTHAGSVWAQGDEAASKGERTMTKQ